MGVREKIANYIGHEFVESLEEKDPCAFYLFDRLNEVPLLKAYILYKKRRVELNIPEGKAIDWLHYLDLATVIPITDVVSVFMKTELGLEEVFGVNISSFLNALTAIGEDDK